MRRANDSLSGSQREAAQRQPRGSVTGSQRQLRGSVARVGMRGSVRVRGGVITRKRSTVRTKGSMEDKLKGIMRAGSLGL